MSLITPSQALTEIANKARNRRLAADLTQAGLARRSGVSLAVLRKFEQTGKISLESFLKLALVLDVLEDIVKILDLTPIEFSSIEEVLKDPTPKNKRGKIK